MEKNKIPTAKEYWDSSEENFQDMSLGRNEFPTRVMVEFAKLHVKAALKAASEKADAYNKPKFKGDVNPTVDLDSILNAYPDSNIK